MLFALGLTAYAACSGTISGRPRDASDDGDAPTDDGEIPDAALVEPVCEDNVCDPRESAADCPWDCQPALARVLPHLFVAPAVGAPRAYTQDDSAGPTWTFDDERISATITDEGDGFFRLDLMAKVALASVSFPYLATAVEGAPSATGAQVFSTFLGGTFEPAGDRPAFGWKGFPYPGAFAPLLIAGTGDEALVVAATNWPPVAVTPFHALHQYRIAYNAGVPAGEQRTYRALLKRVAGAPATGYPAWHLALERYAQWLYAHATPPEPPAWMVANEGFLNVQLENQVTFSRATLDTLWAERGDTWNFMLFWGQMAPYAGTCCGHEPVMDARYLPDLPAFVADVAGGGGHAGYYAREPATGHISTPPGLDWYTERVSTYATDYNANAGYLDVVCRGSASVPGAPASVAAIFANGTVPRATVCEGFQDVYPASASLLSGFVIGDANYSGGPGITPQAAERGTFPSLIRLLMRERLGYLGGSNSDYMLWGPAQNHHVERQAFLLGLKLDIAQWSTDELLAAATEIAALRTAANWWARGPRYRHTAGLVDIPAGVDVRRHVDSTGATLLTVDNWSETAGLTVKHRDCVIALPSARLSIVESPCR
jgi:hypothetical protein